MIRFVLPVHPKGFNADFMCPSTPARTADPSMGRVLILCGKTTLARARAGAAVSAAR